MSENQLNENPNFHLHPIYKNYGADENGKAYNFKTGRLLKQSVDKYGYSHLGVRENKNHPKTVRTNRFIYECFNGVSTNDDVIDHINNDKSDNSIKNLQKITQKQNILNKFVGGYKQDTHKKQIKGKKYGSNDDPTIYKSIYGASQVLNIVPASISRVCKKLQQTAKSKNDGEKYEFSFVETEL